MDLNKINKEIEQFSSDRDWNKFHSVKNLSMALSVESSELLELFQWLTEEESNQVFANKELLQQTEDEIADIFIYLLRIVSKTNSNLEEIVLRKMKQNALKYPVELSKGNNKKYTKL